MLFYAKKYLALELLVALILGGAGWYGARALNVSMPFRFDAVAVGSGIAIAVVITAWTLGVQKGYAIVKGEDYALALTQSLARHYRQASLGQVLAAALAAGGEELFFRGLIQGRWGLVAGAIAFMLAHIGGRAIRVIGYWSIFQGLILGGSYALSENLAVPVIAHGLFDLGAMVHFRRLMASTSIR